jgi:acyl carrier protein
MVEMKNEEIKISILKIIEEINPYEEINEDTKLISDGILDSLTLVILINEIEEEYKITIPEEYVKPECFENVLDIVNLVSKLNDKC